MSVNSQSSTIRFAAETTDMPYMRPKEIDQPCLIYSHGISLIALG